MNSYDFRTFMLSEWVYGKDWVPNAWDFRSAMITAHSRYGLSPFYRVSMKNRNSLPFGNIITVSEGSLGLPHKMFYNLKHDHRIIEAYKMLLRDFAINYGTVAEVANKFAEEMFHFEKRITNAQPLERKHVIMTLGDVQKLAPMLPIFETITTTFSNTRLDDRTPIWIEDVELLKQMSIIVSTTDVAPLNSFLVWSLARHFLPFMSADYRAALRNFDTVLHGHKSAPPAWYQCAKLLHDWVPFAVDVLRFNPELVVSHQSSQKLFDNAGGANDQRSYSSESLVRERVDVGHELVRMIFVHLRQQMQRAVDDNVAIDTDVTAYINDKLGKMNLHVGLPHEVTKSATYVNTYFGEFLWRKLNFIDHLESRWSFAKRKMEDQMVPTNRSDKIVSSLYPTFGSHQNRELVRYSIDLHAIVVSEQAVHKPYFHHRYPLAINFARIGAQISQSLLVAVNALGEQFELRKQERSNVTARQFSLGSFDCLDAVLRQNRDIVPSEAVERGRVELTASAFTARAFIEFQHMVASNRHVIDASVSELLSYERLGLRIDRRQAGLQRLDDDQLFALATLQTHCGRSVSSTYERNKPYVVGHLAQRELFDETWRQVTQLSGFMQCPANTAKCESVL